MNIVIILAGGTGTRVGAEKPKQFIDVLGKPVLAYTCDIFQKNEHIDAIEIVCHHDWMDYCQCMVGKYGLTKVKWIVPGGETFQDSVINGKKHLENLLGTETSLDDNIFIHYGGAPFTSQKIVNAVVEMTEERGSAVTATPCYQLISIKDEGDDTRTSTWVDRDKYTQIACPYGFKFYYLIDIYKRSEEQGILETIEPHTTSLMFALGETINLAYGDQTNIKITTVEDVEMFEGYVLEQRKGVIALITQSESLNVRGQKIDSLEKEYVEYFNNLGISIVPVSNFSDPKVFVDAICPKLIILSGDGIIPADGYGYDRGGWHQDERDAVERKLLDLAIERNIPVVGICHGMQFINYYFGGKARKMEGMQLGISHKVEPDLFVNCYHTNGVYKEGLAASLEVLVTDEVHGTVEAFKHKELPILGIQWHPERSGNDKKTIEWVEKEMLCLFQ